MQPLVGCSAGCVFFFYVRGFVGSSVRWCQSQWAKRMAGQGGDGLFGGFRDSEIKPVSLSCAWHKCAHYLKMYVFCTVTHKTWDTIDEEMIPEHRSINVSFTVSDPRMSAPFCFMWWTYFFIKDWKLTLFRCQRWNWLTQMNLQVFSKSFWDLTFWLHWSPPVFTPIISCHSRLYIY